MSITLPPETTAKLQASITRYFAEELDQDIGQLKAGMFLDYCLAEIGPAIYNQGIADAQAYFQERTTDLDAVHHEKEFTYWAAADAARSRKQK